MKISLFTFLTAILAASLALPQSQTAASATKKAPSKTASAASVAGKKAPASAPAVRRTVAPAPKSGKTTRTVRKTTGKKTATAPTWRNRQLTPTPDRYREIQQALADKGYLKQEPNGVWDADSVEALKQFQTDQQLMPSGKINSSSLIGLGLGPKMPEGPVVLPPVPLPDPATP